MDEFQLIELILTELGNSRNHPQVRIGPGDDAGVIAVPEGYDLVVTTDVLREGTHFPAAARSDLIAYRALAVNFSDLAAMGAKPYFHTVALSIETGEPDWIRGFAQGIAFASQKYGSVVLGGNLNRAPLSIAVTAHGLVPHGKVLRRIGSQTGDDIWLTGSIGATQVFLNQNDRLPNLSLADLVTQQCPSSSIRYFIPPDRSGIAARLHPYATAAIDVSDGLIADLSHILRQSQVGARLLLDRVPTWQGVAVEEAIGSDDSYELLFTSPSQHRDTLVELARETDTEVSRIGSIEEDRQLRVYQGTVEISPPQGYSHF